MERVELLQHIKATLTLTLDSHQYAYRQNRSTDDAINIALYTVLSHLEQRGAYACLLSMDYSSPFNTIIPGRLVSKMFSLCVDDNICRWTLDFLTDWPQKQGHRSYVSATEAALWRKRPYR